MTQTHTRTQPTYKHRATEPLPAVDRPAKAGSHRAPRTTEYLIAAVLLAALVALLVALLGRS
jgi:hypothetical protein